jgi:hypothetical protein
MSRIPKRGGDEKGAGCEFLFCEFYVFGKAVSAFAHRSAQTGWRKPVIMTMRAVGKFFLKKIAHKNRHLPSMACRLASAGMANAYFSKQI